MFNINFHNYLTAIVDFNNRDITRKLDLSVSNPNAHKMVKRQLLFYITVLTIKRSIAKQFIFIASVFLSSRYTTLHRDRKYFSQRRIVRETFHR